MSIMRCGTIVRWISGLYHWKLWPGDTPQMTSTKAHISYESSRHPAALAPTSLLYNSPTCKVKQLIA